jgi:integrase
LSRYCRAVAVATIRTIYKPVQAFIKENQMSVRKRRWKNRDGSQSEAWVVAYSDRAGKRHLKTFDRKRDADIFEGTVGVDVRAGRHVPDSDSVTVLAAGKLWLLSAEAAGVERSTLEHYRQHLELHILPFIGAVRLSVLTMPGVRHFEDRLRATRSKTMVRKVMGSLSAILADAQERGLVGQNVARGLRKNRRPGKEKQEARQKGKLEVGVHIPAPDEVRAIIAALEGRWRPLLLTAIFTGLRASELRGLRWLDVDLKHAEINVRQRADRYNQIGPLKSAAAERTVPLSPMLVNTLREWKVACPVGDLGLVFPNTLGRIESLSNIIAFGLHPVMLASGVVVDGKPKYSGLHALRHFYASWCINRRVDGGLELPIKLVQARLGHASITMTADRYGHLFPRGDDGAELAAAEKAFLGA